MIAETPTGPRKLDPDRSRDLLGDTESRALTIYTILLDWFGPEVLHGDEDSEAWDPIFLYNNIEEQFRVSFPVENENKLQAILLALETDAFYEDPSIFTAICLALSSGDLGDMVNGVLEDLSLPEALWGMIEVGLLRDDEQEMAPAVDALMARLIRDETLASEEEEIMSAVLDTGMDLRAELEYLGVPSGHLTAIQTMLDKLIP